MIPGTIIKFAGLESMSDFNGRFGVIKKKLQDERFQVMIDGEKDMGVKPENIEVVKQCPNDGRFPTEGILCWPHVKSVNTPTMQWLNDRSLRSEFIDPFERTGIFAKSFDMMPESDLALGQFYNDTPWIERNVEMRMKIMEKYEDRLKTLLNWTTPTMWIRKIRTDGEVENQVVVYYDKDSKGVVNDWLEYRHSQIPSVVRPEIRGPFIYIQLMPKKYLRKNTPRTEHLNLHKAQFHISRYYGQPDKRDEKKYRKYILKLHKISKLLPISNTCGKVKCKHCKFERDTAQELSRDLDNSVKFEMELTKKNSRKLFENNNIFVD